MMIESIVIKEFGAMPGLIKSQINQLTKESLVAAATNHYYKYMPLHFTMAAYSRYGYKRRKGEGQSGKAFYSSYTGQKLRKKGHLLPLVWSGKSKELALDGDPKIAATRYRATLIQRARGLNRRHPKSQIFMNEEIRAVTQSEIDAAALSAGRAFRRRAAELKATKTTRV
jgi:hypothetical protein